MNRIRSTLHRPGLWIAVLVAGGVAVAAALAQSKNAPSSSAREYDYVGVGGSLMRVERESGRVEILEQRNSPNMSLALEQARPWTWREIRIDNRPTRPLEREPRGIQGPQTGD